MNEQLAGAGATYDVSTTNAEVQSIQEYVLKIEEKFRIVLSEGRSGSRSGRESSIRTSSSQRRALEMKEALESSKARTIFTSKADALQQQMAFDEVQEERRKKEREAQEEKLKKEREAQEEAQRKLKRLETLNEVKRLRERGDEAALEAAIRVNEEDDAQRNSFVEDPGHVDGNQTQTFRSGLSARLPGVDSSHSAQVHASPATNGVGTGTTPLVGSGMAGIQRARDGERVTAPNLSNSVSFRDPDGRVSHPGRDFSTVTPGSHFFSSPVVDQPGRGGLPVTAQSRAPSRPTPSDAASGVRRLSPTTDLPYVRRLGNHSAKLPPGHTSSPHMTNDPLHDDRGPSTPSPVFGPPTAGVPLRSGPNLDRPTPREESSSSLPDAPAPVLDARWSADRQLAISSIKSNTVVKKFNGRDAGFYRRWKADLEQQQIDRLWDSGFRRLSPYEVLQIDPELGLEEVKKKYRWLSMLVHPDNNPDNRERAQAAFRAVEKADAYLEDNKWRKKCFEIVEEAKGKTGMIMEEKRRTKQEEAVAKGLPATGENIKIEEDDPVKYKHAVVLLTRTLFTNLELDLGIVKPWQLESP